MPRQINGRALELNGRRLLRRFQQLSWRDRLLLIEACLCLMIARVAIALLPFRHVGSLASRKIHRRHSPDCPNIGPRVRWAIHNMAVRVPWRAMCFERGVAVQLMLRMRGIPSVLYYGVRQDAVGLKAHVWVRDGDIDVIGGELAEQFSVLATFPSLDSGLAT